MINLQPYQGMTITIESTTYTFAPDPYFPGDELAVFVIEGGESLIYQLKESVKNALWALKVPKLSHRGEHIERATNALAKYKHIPSLAFEGRICLTKARHRKLIKAFPELEYAILMPWLPGKSWSSFMLDRRDSARYTPSQARSLALASAQVLAALEAHQLAHTDIAGSNVILTPDLKGVRLLDIEGLYMLGTLPPKLRSQGSPGYQHRYLDSRGQWRLEGDRFSGAILLTEMLTWWEPLVRAQTPDDAESLFQPHELQVIGTSQWQAVRNALWSICPPALELFDIAWASSDLIQCPELRRWLSCFTSSW